MVKKVVFSLMAVFLLWQSYKLIFAVIQIELSSWISIFFVAWVINIFVTGVFAIPGFVLPTQQLMPANYYRIKQPERLLRWYRILRVEYFRRGLLATLWRSKKQQKQYFDGTAAGMEHLKIQSKKSEFGHLLPFIILMGVALLFCFQGHFKLGIITALINFIGNYYPILLQRHHRWRIERIQKRFGMSTSG